MMMADEVPSIPLAEDEIQVRFNHLQKKLIPLWKSMDHISEDEQTIVVVPSLTVDYPLQGSVLQAYEERFLFLLLLLRQPKARLIYVTSQVILPCIVEYYLGLLPGVIASHARQRLLLISPQDGASEPLSVKLLRRPRLLERIRSMIVNPDRAHLLPFNTTHFERDLALKLGIPMYAADPQFLHFGTKSGSRELFAKLGVPHPLGIENIRSRQDAVQALANILERKPTLDQCIIKHNEGVSGDGNALLDLTPFKGTKGIKTPTENDLEHLQFESSSMTAETYWGKMEQVGGIIEERISGGAFRSPSVQMRITPLGQVELLSTHDQMLGGPGGQSFLGSRFPADPAYAPQLSREAVKIGEHLAREGVLGRFAIDFVCAETDGEWMSYAVELNLRKGGTTHPFLTLQFLTDGTYDAETARFVTPGGVTKCFIASDHIESPEYRALSPDEIFDIAVRHGLHFGQTQQKGVVFHMMSALGEYGRMGLTAVHDSLDQAENLFNRTVAVLDEESRLALKSRPLP